MTRVATVRAFTHTFVQYPPPERFPRGGVGGPVEDLSPRQREILDFVVAQVAQSGVVPSYREIGGALGIESTNAVSDHLKALIRKGYLERVGDPGRPRSLRLTEQATGFVQD